MPAEDKTRNDFSHASSNNGAAQELKHLRQVELPAAWPATPIWVMLARSMVTPSSTLNAPRKVLRLPFTANGFPAGVGTFTAA